MKTKTSARRARRDNRNAPVIELVPARLRLKKILVPVDFSEFSAKAITYALRFAEQFHATLVLVHAVEPVRYPESILIPPAMEVTNQARQTHARDRLNGFAAQYVPREIACETVVRLGQPFSEITATARELDVDLIVIATHGHTGLKHLLLGSTAERVVRLAPCPVLTVREREHEFV